MSAQATVKGRVLVVEVKYAICDVGKTTSGGIDKASNTSRVGKETDGFFITILNLHLTPSVDVRDASIIEMTRNTPEWQNKPFGYILPLPDIHTHARLMKWCGFDNNHIMVIVVKLPFTHELVHVRTPKLMDHLGVMGEVYEGGCGNTGK